MREASAHEPHSRGRPPDRQVKCNISNWWPLFPAPPKPAGTLPSRIPGSLDRTQLQDSSLPLPTELCGEG